MFGLEQPDIVPTTFANEGMQTSSQGDGGRREGNWKKKKEKETKKPKTNKKKNPQMSMKIALLPFHGFWLEQLEFLNQEPFL